MASSLAVTSAGDPQPLPSLPGSPTASEDLSRGTAWIDPEEEETTPRKKQDKGKGRVVNLDVEEDASREVSEAEDEGPGSYPPTNEDANETRRVEEVSSINLGNRMDA